MRRGRHKIGYELFGGRYAITHEFADEWRKLERGQILLAGLTLNQADEAAYRFKLRVCLDKIKVSR